MKKNNVKKSEVKKAMRKAISYTYGNDFEFHLFSKEKNKMVSAIDVLKHDKYNPIDLGDGIKAYYDNILIETSFPPYNSKEEMVKRFKTVFSRLQNLVGDKYEIVPKAAHVYDDSELQNPIAQEAGCSVNFNAYTVAPNPATKFNGGLRSAGAHFHVGAKHLCEHQTRLNAIKLMDIFVGVPSVILSKDKSELERRKLYGKSSEHRPTPFGLEYRPLSSGILSSREATELVHDLINYSLKQIEDKKDSEILNSVDSSLVQKAIDNCDTMAAEEVLKKVNMPEDLMARIKKNYEFDFKKSWGLETIAQTS